jgi:hypothetical protein
MAASQCPVRSFARPYEDELLHREGHLVPILMAGSPRTDEAGAFVGSLGMASDRSKLRKREDKLELARRSLKAVSDSAATKRSEVLADLL